MLDGSARRALVQEAVGKSSREVDRLLAAVDPALAAPRERLRALGDGRWELSPLTEK